jgi:acyl-CoA synthetase (AMP-forming)/AMP-acid ligase II
VAISEAAKSLKITLTTLFTKPTKAALNYFFRDEGVLVNLKKLNAPAETLQKLEQINPGDIALYLHTSGTTSKPKGVPLSHYNLVSSVKNIVATYDLTKLDKGLLVMPLFHVHGLVCGLLAPLFSGGSLVIPVNGQFSASNFWNTVVEHQVNWYTCVPTIHKILLLRSHKEYPAFNSPNLRFIRSSSSTLSPSILYELEKTFHVPVLEAYSMTEASHMMTSNPLPSKGLHLHHTYLKFCKFRKISLLGQRKAGTVGSAVGELVVSVRDEVNKEVATGEEGEVCVKGPSVFSGYKDNPEANEEGFMEGWFRTGDRGSKDPAGFITLTGRIKELINRGGEKISPNEIDSALLEFKGVIEAVSFGAPDPLYGEVVHAAVVIKDPEDPKKMELLLKEFLLTKLAPFKVPQVFYFSNDLPKTATGKIQRKHIASKFLNTQ